MCDYVGDWGIEDEAAAQRGSLASARIKADVPAVRIRSCVTSFSHRAKFVAATFPLSTMTDQLKKAQIVAAVMRNLQDVLANHRHLAPALTFVVHEAPPPGAGSTAPLSRWLVMSDSVSQITRAGDERTETKFQPWASFSISNDLKRVDLDWQLGFTYGRGFLYEVETDADGNPVLRNEVATVIS